MAVVSLGTDILHDVVNWQPRAGTHIIDMIPLIDVKRGTINAQNSRAIKSLYSSLKEITPSCCRSSLINSLISHYTSTGVSFLACSYCHAATLVVDVSHSSVEYQHLATVFRCFPPLDEALGAIMPKQHARARASN